MRLHFEFRDYAISVLAVLRTLFRIFLNEKLNDCGVVCTLNLKFKRLQRLNM